jgi:hypothetical protein
LADLPTSCQKVVNLLKSHSYDFLHRNRFYYLHNRQNIKIQTIFLHFGQKKFISLFFSFYPSHWGTYVHMYVCMFPYCTLTETLIPLPRYIQINTTPHHYIPTWHIESKTWFDQSYDHCISSYNTGAGLPDGIFTYPKSQLGYIL